ncbi:hypothetical protein PR048_003775 [Dryococelus australis]|uniref:Uncharacterized protein n=1 Tax=Dryococelus australis TaxID=614101 RepID=A0ABQ9IP03_9NEOP|nr:hypothetical protein PR048_003775 [Dryococelus australis]
MQSELPQIHNLRASVVSALIPEFFCYWRVFILELQISLTKSDLPEQNVILFKLRCPDFYIGAVNHIVRFPFDDPIIRSLEILDPAKLLAFQSIVPLASLFPRVAKQDEIQQLDTEWRLLRNREIGCGDSSMDAIEEFWNNVRE